MCIYVTLTAIAIPALKLGYGAIHNIKQDSLAPNLSMLPKIGSGFISIRKQNLKDICHYTNPYSFIVWELGDVPFIFIIIAIQILWHGKVHCELLLQINCLHLIKGKVGTTGILFFEKTLKLAGHIFSVNYPFKLFPM